MSENKEENENRDKKFLAARMSLIEASYQELLEKIKIREDIMQKKHEAERLFRKIRADMATQNDSEQYGKLSKEISELSSDLARQLKKSVETLAPIIRYYTGMTRAQTKEVDRDLKEKFRLFTRHFGKVCSSLDIEQARKDFNDSYERLKNYLAA